MTTLVWFLACAAAVVVTWFVGRWYARGPVLVDSSTSERPTFAELRAFLDGLPDGLASVDARGIIRSTNAAMLRLIGESDLAGRSLIEVLCSAQDDPSRRAEIGDWWARASRGPDPEPFLVRRGAHDDQDGRPCSLEISLSTPTVAGQGVGSGDRSDPRRIVRVRDVSEEQHKTSALEQARRRFQQAFHSAPTGMALVRLDDGRVIDANQSLGEMLGRSVEAMVGRTLRELTHPDDVRDAVPHQARLELGIVDSYRLDQRYRRSDGEYIWARTRVAATEDDGVMLAITHIEDITEQRRTAELLTHAARHDELTGLPNRSFLQQSLAERLDHAPPESIAVLFIDLDHFKVVNDSLGHEAGDVLLRAMADRLTEVVRGADLLARFGGDEFVVVIDGGGRPAQAGDVAERIRRAFLAPVFLDDSELFVTASIGYCTNSDPSMTPHDLLRFADAAMYRAKARGRDAVEAFDVAEQDHSAMALRTTGELRRGIERGEVVPYFQPIVELASGVVVGYEVLARWLHPERGLLTPAEFLALAEETGQMVELGAVMLRDSLAQVSRWRAAGHDIGRGSIAVNISTRQLVDPAFHRLVGEVLAETGVDANSLWLEITETTLLADLRAVSVALRELRSLGLHLSVDDFGTGYSSLTYLKRFPVEAIKIDRAFVGGLGLENDDTTIVSAVISLGQALGLTVIAEGIETPLQLSMLREFGCDRGQGYLFGRPRPAALLEAERLGTRV